MGVAAEWCQRDANTPRLSPCSFLRFRFSLEYPTGRARFWHACRHAEAGVCKLGLVFSSSASCLVAQSPGASYSLARRFDQSFSILYHFFFQLCVTASHSSGQPQVTRRPFLLQTEKRP